MNTDSETVATSADSLKRTPLFESHRSLGGKIVPFAGWEMPVQYPAGIVAEHLTVRSRVGLFDVSHMGEILVEGPRARELLSLVSCNDVGALVNGKAQYSALTTEQGGVVDDIIIYQISPTKFFLCVNASNADRDFEWIKQHNHVGADVRNVSAQFGQIAIQGPLASVVLVNIGIEEVGEIAPFHFREFSYEGDPLIVARTGYTGEDGFELFVSAERTVHLWEELLRVGEPFGILPIGLGARDSLRLEACYPLHGHELGCDITAVESGIGWVVKPDKATFLGHQVLAREKREGSARSLVGFFVEDPGIVRHADKLFDEHGNEIGWCTSGTKTPTVGRALGLGIVQSSINKIGNRIYAEVRGKKLACRIVKRPFYQRPKV